MMERALIADQIPLPAQYTSKNKKTPRKQKLGKKEEETVAPEVLQELNNRNPILPEKYGEVGVVTKFKNSRKTKENENANQ